MSQNPQMEKLKKPPNGEIENKANSAQLGLGLILANNFLYRHTEKGKMLKLKHNSKIGELGLKIGRS
jgi:hypothetical protein